MTGGPGKDLRRSNSGPVARLVLDHGDWQLSIQPAGQRMCTAYRQSPDGRHRRYVVAPDAAGLLEALDAIEAKGEQP